jgi:hypothetical protein
MSIRTRATLIVSGIAALLLLPLLLAPATVGAKPAGHACSVSGLSYTEKVEGMTEGVGVANLRAKSVSCSRARSLAGTVAKDILADTEVPARVGGMKVTVKEPCAGCTPDWQVRARSGDQRVTFTVKGGA